MSEDKRTLKSLALVARKAESLGLHDVAFQMHKAYRAASVLVEGAATEVELDSWTEFETWFSRNRSQGLEFVFADRYGEGAEQTRMVKTLLEGYDVLERQLHEFYLLLKEAEAPQTVPATEEPVVEETTEEVLEEPAAEGDEEELDLDAEVDETAEEGDEEVVEDEEEIADEVLAPEASAVPSINDLPEMKTVKRIKTLLRKSNVNTNEVIYRGHASKGYRVMCANAEAGDKAEALFAKFSWAATRINHASGRIIIDVIPGV